MNSKGERVWEQGTITTLNADKKFGFVRGFDGASVFFHLSKVVFQDEVPNSLSEVPNSKKIQELTGHKPYHELIETAQYLSDGEKVAFMKGHDDNKSKSERDKGKLSCIIVAAKTKRSQRRLQDLAPITTPYSQITAEIDNLASYDYNGDVKFRKKCESIGFVRKVHAKYGWIIFGNEGKCLLFFVKDVVDQSLFVPGTPVYFQRVYYDNTINYIASDLQLCSSLIYPEKVDGKFAPVYINECVPVEEQRDIEFKSLCNSQDKPKTLINYLDKYLNAFVNTNGGDLYFGVQDDGIVLGIYLDRAGRDDVRRGVDRATQHMNPSISPDIYDIRFLPVLARCLGGGVPIEDVYVVVVSIEAVLDVVMDRNNKPWIRRDGSVFEMSGNLIIDKYKKRDAGNAGPPPSEEFVKKCLIELLGGPSISPPPPSSAVAVAAQLSARATKFKPQQDGHVVDFPALPQSFTRSQPASPQLQPAFPSQPPSPQLQPSLPPQNNSSVAFDDELIAQFVEMGYKRSQVLDVMYILSKEGVQADLGRIFNKMDSYTD